MWLFFVFELYGLFTAVAGECHCSNASTCTESHATTCRQHSGCIKGWFGPTCQKQNIALKQPADQSSDYYIYGGNDTAQPLNLTADYAVDGIVPSDFNDGPCAQTKTTDTTPIWIVFLKTSNHDKIHHMKLYLSKKPPSRNDGMAILVDDQICYEWPPTERPDYVTDVTCRQPLSGSTVTILTPQEFLTLCEVQIFVCSDGWFGDDCDKQCHCLDNKEVCDKINGHCLSGCTPGFNGINCQTPCSDGWFGYNCDKRCFCLDNMDICNKITGRCSRGCAPGYTGANCQTQNVALKRTAIQTSVYYGPHEITKPLNLTAHYAVDGLVSNRSRSSPCTLTDRGDMTPSWTVFLNTSRHDKIHRMKLYLSNKSPSQNKGMEILVDNQSCYEWSPAERRDYIRDVTCRQPLSGTSVTIRTPQEFLALCEVQIFVCSDGWFGDDCDKQCHCLDNKEVCDKITGHCSSGCTSGFSGKNCQTLCSDGSFGNNCDKRCHCLDRVCNRMTGHCSSRCTLGFSGANCQTQNVALGAIAVQSSVYYEPYETSRPLNLTANYAVDGRVSDNLRDSPCAHTDERDRTPSWTVFPNSSRHDKIHRLKLYLRKSWLDRYEGMEILVDNQICYVLPRNKQPDYITDVTCRQPLSGNRVTIQTRQEFLTLCEVQIFVCSDGWFGDDCDKQCHCLDNKEVCDKITGKCSSGCIPGFTGANCHSLCSDGLFGDDCDKQCHCLDNKEVCDKMTGHCSNGCASGFSDANCQTHSTLNSNQPSSYLTTLAVAVSSGAVILIIVLVSSLCNRRLRKTIQALETTRGEPYADLDQATMEEMPEPCYSEIGDNRGDAKYMNSSV
ncbi:multiple epidermal growth factor-like domains protein 10 [Haliotis asinina]|uniref:multiple epidermal growth factor-like domains protein 10 n=1 Tax=Haliotis asinina TaxID=109174 RepID=UPI003531F2B8